MNTYAPNYYSKFKCIAGKCRHSCCIGWEIDIDPDTLDFYSTLDGDIADRLKDAISYEGDPHFKLSEGDRCPFLNQKGLCDIICALGEDALCNICADHPRFRNFYSDSVELGPGLCCEAAADLILNNAEPFELVQLEAEGTSKLDEQEAYVLNKRNKLIDIMKDRTKTVEERHLLLLDEIDSTIPSNTVSDWCDFFLKLERLDPEWTDTLNKLKNTDLKSFYQLTDKEHQISLEQLTIYFLYRHIPSAIYDGDIASKVKFAVLSARFIYAIAKVAGSEDSACSLPSLPEGNGTVPRTVEEFRETLLNIARMFSAEIEYSDENLEKIFNELY